MSSVAAVIPVYRPESSALHSLLDSLSTADVPVLVTDDASPCTFDHVLRSVAERGIPVVRHPRNAGIARGLNEGLAFAREQGAAWLLTVDQDSTLPVGYAGNAYYHGNRYYSGGRYETGAFNYQGRRYDNRYQQGNGSYLYGGQYQHYPGQSSSQGRGSHASLSPVRGPGSGFLPGFSPFRRP